MLAATLVTVIVIGVGGPPPGAPKPLVGQPVQIGTKVTRTGQHGIAHLRVARGRRVIRVCDQVKTVRVSGSRLTLHVICNLL
jgi:hypothetical protein